MKTFLLLAAVVAYTPDGTAPVPPLADVVARPSAALGTSGPFGTYWAAKDVADFYRSKYGWHIDRIYYVLGSGWYIEYSL